MEPPLPCPLLQISECLVCIARDVVPECAVPSEHSCTQPIADSVQSVNLVILGNSLAIWLNSQCAQESQLMKVVAPHLMCEALRDCRGWDSHLTALNRLFKVCGKLDASFNSFSWKVDTFPSLRLQVDQYLSIQDLGQAHTSSAAMSPRFCFFCKCT